MMPPNVSRTIPMSDIITSSIFEESAYPFFLHIQPVKQMSKILKIRNQWNGWRCLIVLSSKNGSWLM